MSRLPLVEPEALPAFLKQMHDGARPDDWSTRTCARAFAAHPDLLERYLSFYYPFHTNDGAEPALEPRLKELVRLRIATLNGCKTCKAARLDPDHVTEEEAARRLRSAPGGGTATVRRAARCRRPGGSPRSGR